MNVGVRRNYLSPLQRRLSHMIITYLVYNGYGHYRNKDNLFFTFAEKAIMSFIGILHVG